MPGFPVVVATNNIGIPVKPVLVGDLNRDRAPVMTIATNGIGTPIVISQLGAPFVIEGYTP